MSNGEDFWESGELATLRRNLRRWHRAHGRELPWRDIGDPYRVWISEIMLQQTTVAAVVPYYERFLERFPTVESLAAADEQQVLRLWEGLGYYSRARNIHKAARQIVTERCGRFPAEVAQLTALPGIGRYTAGAIASFAFDRPAPIVEANTLRLYCRLLGYEGDPRSTAGQKLLWSFAEQLVPRRRPGEFNQALIDVGATICTPADPDCPACPLRTLCRAAANGRVAQIPRARDRTPITPLVEASVAIHKRGAFLLRRCGPQERWAGLWDFLRFDVVDGTPMQEELPPASRRLLAQQVSDISGLTVTLPRSESVIRHSVTRYRITLHCLRAEHQSGRLRRDAGPLAWVRPGALDDYPLSVTGRRFARILARRPSAG